MLCSYMEWKLTPININMYIYKYTKWIYGLFSKHFSIYDARYNVLDFTSCTKCTHVCNHPLEGSLK